MKSGQLKNLMSAKQMSVHLSGGREWIWDRCSVHIGWVLYI